MKLAPALRLQRALRAVDSVTPPSVVIAVSASETDRAMFSADRNHGDNGLMDLVERLREGGVKGIAVCELQARDVQRHEIITSVLKLYSD